MMMMILLLLLVLILHRIIRLHHPKTRAISKTILIRLKNFFLEIHLKKEHCSCCGRKIHSCYGRKKVRFSENLSKLFTETDDIFDNQKIDIGGDLPEITIPNTQTMFKELNDGKLPEKLKIFGRN